MKILVVISQSLDAEVAVRITEDSVDLASSKLTLDKMDEYGVEEALRLREAGLDAEIIAAGVGSAELQTSLRAGLALGVDRAVLIRTEFENDVLEMGRVLATLCADERADLIFVGGQQGNSDSHALGPAIAENLDWPHVAWVNSLQWSDGKLKGTHDVDGGYENFEVDFPVVLTTQQGLNEPRYPTVLNIRRSSQKEVKMLSVDSRGGPSVKILRQNLETRRRQGLIVDGKDLNEAAAQMVKFLRQEAKVIE